MPVKNYLTRNFAISSIWNTDKVANKIHQPFLTYSYVCGKLVVRYKLMLFLVGQQNYVPNSSSDIIICNVCFHAKSVDTPPFVSSTAAV